MLRVPSLWPTGLFRVGSRALWTQHEQCWIPGVTGEHSAPVSVSLRKLVLSSAKCSLATTTCRSFPGTELGQRLFFFTVKNENSKAFLYRVHTDTANSAGRLQGFSFDFTVFLFSYSENLTEDIIICKYLFSPRLITSGK